MFAWTHDDILGIDPMVIVHRLSTNPKMKPVRQKRRSLNAERSLAVKEEVDKLLKAGFVKEARYPDWLANVVMVKKANGKWRMCVDFTDLNKVCPKDSFPLPRIDQLVDATAGHGLLSFMDAYSGYNQIRMHEPDQEKTAFITDRGLYCYKVMPFGLKNAGATYQRLVNSMFVQQIGHTMEVYVDDMITKSLNPEDHIKDLREIFDILRKYKMRLNPAKCAFGVSSGKFLGFMVNQRGTKINPEKIQALVNMKSPKNVKEIQRLTGQVAALNRFVSRATDKCLPFFKALRKGKEMKWTEECEEAFQKLKEYLGSPHLLVKPIQGEPLFLYLAVSEHATSSILVREDDGVQRPIYYTSRALVDAETRYLSLEKIVLALIVSARRLRPYFQAHTIIVLTDQPIRQVLAKPDISGRMTKWAIELGEFDILYHPRTSLKRQAVANFIAEFTEGDIISLDPKEEHQDRWSLYVDGSSSKRGCGGGFIAITPDNVEWIL